MNRKKICAIITARPSYSRIFSLLKSIEQSPNLDLEIVVAASALLNRYGSVVDVIEKDGFKITGKVYNILEGESLLGAAKTTGIGIIELSNVLDNIKPDFVITIADRFETMATAITASYMNIPLIHIQGGEVTGNIDEKVRHSITKLADYHFVASNDAFNRVLKLGEDEASIFNEGCPSIDIANEVKSNPAFKQDIFSKYKGIGYKPNIEEDFLVVMQHPVTTEYGESLKQTNITLESIHELNIPTFWFWPNVDAGSDGVSKALRIYREKFPSNKIHFVKNMEPKDFLRLLMKSKVLIGNSSVGIRECSFLGIPVVNIGTRQNRRERGENVIDVGYNRKDIKNAIIKWLNSDRPNQSTIYGKGDSGKRIASIIENLEPKYHKTISY